MVEKLKTADKGPSCHECVDNTVATKYCQTCGLNLCPECSNFHSRCVRFVGHKIEDVSKAPDLIAPISRYCSKHQELLKYYCESCLVMVCNDCMVSKQHRNHQIALVEEIQSRINSELEEQVKIGEQAEVILKKHVTEGKDFKKKIKEADRKSARMLAEIFKEIRKAVSNREKQLMEEICQRSNTQSFDDFEKKASTLSEMLNYVKSISGEGKCQNVEILNDLKAQLVSQLNEIQAQQILTNMAYGNNVFGYDQYGRYNGYDSYDQYGNFYGNLHDNHMQNRQNRLINGNLLSVVTSETKSSQSGALNFDMYLVEQKKHDNRGNSITNILAQLSV